MHRDCKGHKVEGGTIDEALCHHYLSGFLPRFETIKQAPCFGQRTCLHWQNSMHVYAKAIKPTWDFHDKTLCMFMEKLSNLHYMAWDFLCT